MSHVTFQTARLLKDAGFPKPWKAFGQVWYILGMPVLVGSAAGSLIHPESDDCVFAPTPTDILRELYGAKTWFYPDQGYVVYNIIENKDVWYEHENHAEACAAAWLALHEK